MLFRCLGLAVLAITTCGSVAYAGDEGHAGFWRSAHVTIDPEGKVTSLELDQWKSEKDLIGEKLKPLLRSWTFEPGRVNGKPALTETTVTIHLDMQKINDDRYAITLLSAETGATWEAMRLPAYPMREVKALAEAKIYLLASYDSDGKIGNLTVEDAEVKGSKSDFDEFVAAIRAEAKASWRIRPERVGGQGMPGVVRVPVAFCFDLASASCQILGQKMDQRRSARGLVPLDLATALDSRTKLLTHVAGISF